MECSILLQFYVDKREKCKLEFWIKVFFFLKWNNFWEILNGSQDRVGDENDNIFPSNSQISYFSSLRFEFHITFK